MSKESWVPCTNCNGQAKKSRGLSKKIKLSYQKELENYKTGKTNTPPILPKAPLYLCTTCSGLGIIKNETPINQNTTMYPHVAIIGAGIGGTALAVACLHRGIPFTLYERDVSFDSRSQGYGLTLQQAAKTLKELGITELKNGIISTKHIVHNTNGEILGEWGTRKWLEEQTLISHNKHHKRTNIHIARQGLRARLLEELENNSQIKWGHQLISISNTKTNNLQFLVDGKIKHVKADLVVGADGIRSSVRKLTFKNLDTPLRYLNCIVILGICPLQNLKDIQSKLLDSKTVFQTANGTERIYMMPYTADTIMWQLSYPIVEQEAIKLSKQDPEKLKKEAILKTNWHSPIPEIIKATPECKITGYPVYDRDALDRKSLQNLNDVTLIGDALHPMSPFKGQGANQALIDALELARSITKNCNKYTDWRKTGIRNLVLINFEKVMIERSSIKVADSRGAAVNLHSIKILEKKDRPRGKN